MKKHSHNFEHTHSHYNDKTESKNILITFFLNISFVIIELIGGMYSNSISIISDAIHDLGDSITLLFTFFLSLLANKGRDDKYTYGYKRMLVVGALINCIILISGATYIYIKAYERFMNPEPINAKIMLILAILGILVNGISVYRMNKTTTLMSKTVMLHLLEDLLGWIAVAVSSVLILMFNLYRVDDLLSFAIATLIMFNAVRTFKDAFEILLQKVPKNIDIKEVKSNIMNLENVIDTHDIHVWTLDGEDIIFSTHIVVKEGLSQDELGEMRNKIKINLEELGINHATLEFETQKEAIAHGHLKL